MQASRRSSDPAPSHLDPWLDVNRRAEPTPKRAPTLAEVWDLAPWWARLPVILLVMAVGALLAAIVIDTAIGFAVGLP